MLTVKNFHGYQLKLTKRILAKRSLAVWAKMGAGKTVTTLTAIAILLRDMKIIAPLVIAPLKVANSVWPKEVKKWAHLVNMRVVTITGNEVERREALKKPADVYVINRENIPWLVDYLGNDWFFDMLVLDESQSFKNSESIRFKKLKKIKNHKKANVQRFLELTGSPSPKGYIDLWSQFFLLDGGQRLGTSLGAYRRRWFDKNEYEHQYRLKEGSKEEIDDRINDLTTVVESYKGLPELNIVEHVIPWDKKSLKRYKDFERDMLMPVKTGGKEALIKAVNAGVLAGKLLQLCQGRIYDEDKVVHEIHTLKIEYLRELRELLYDKQVVILYWFKSDLMTLLEYFPDGQLLDKHGIVEDRWNAGEVNELFLHPASGGHGLNLQDGGHTILAYGSFPNLELWEQVIARLRRQGQKAATVTVHRLLMENSWDMRARDIIDRREDEQNGLMKAIRDRLLDL